nr:ATP-dependent DNA helicase [Bacillus subtilis]
MKQSTLELFLERLPQNDIREEFAELIEDALLANDEFFYVLSEESKEVAGSHRLEIKNDQRVKKAADELCRLLDKIGEALVFESEMYTIDQYELSVVEEYVEQMAYSLSLYQKDAISWLEKKEAESTFVVMPRTVAEVLGEKVFSKKIPYIFSSATLSEGGSFDYIADSLGIHDYLSLTVDSPYDYDEQMSINLYAKTDMAAEQKTAETIETIKRYKGRTLVLFPSFEELNEFKELSAAWEARRIQFSSKVMRKSADLVEKFQEEEETVLCSVHLWEGLDIPGDALKNVTIWSLPFPPHDPVFTAKRNGAKKDPFEEVDLPYMLLRVRQGIGRLIRSNQDSGSIHIYAGGENERIIDEVKKVLPVEPHMM